jgi:tripartite-type tricarboxylate transporter receptor subunit TctC
LRVIAVAAPARSAALPDVPTGAESGLPGFEAVQYYGLSAPAGIPRASVERLNKEPRSIIGSEETTKRIVADGGDPIASTPEQYAANVEREEGVGGVNQEAGPEDRVNAAVGAADPIARSAILGP